MGRYVAYAASVKELVDDGEPLDVLEAYIDGAPLDEDERAALWLLATAGHTDTASPHEHLLTLA